MDKSWRVILAFVGIFMAGTVTGGLLALRIAPSVARHQPSPVGNPPPNVAPQQFNPNLLRRLTDPLDLSKEQKEKVKLVEGRGNEELRRLRRETQHSVELIIERTQDEISTLLTPEQKTKFDEAILRHRERIKKFFQDQDLQQRRRREGGPGERMKEGQPPAPK